MNHRRSSYGQMCNTSRGHFSAKSSKRNTQEIKLHVRTCKRSKKKKKKNNTRPHSKPSDGRNPWPPVAGRLAQKVDRQPVGPREAKAKEQTFRGGDGGGGTLVSPASSADPSTKPPSQRKEQAKCLG